MAIEIRNITKSYGSKKVVDDVSVTIPTGKITSFIGPNGAGKSTVQMCIRDRFGGGLPAKRFLLKLENIPYIDKGVEYVKPKLLKKYHE